MAEFAVARGDCTKDLKVAERDLMILFRTASTFKVIRRISELGSLCVRAKGGSLRSEPTVDMIYFLIVTLFFCRQRSRRATNRSTNSREFCANSPRIEKYERHLESDATRPKQRMQSPPFQGEGK